MELGKEEEKEKEKSLASRVLCGRSWKKNSRKEKTKKKKRKLE